MLLKSFSKINLSLNINRKLKKNKLHDIQSYFCLINLFDQIKIKKIKGRKDLVKFKGKFSKYIKKTNKVIIVEECMKTGGIGAELIALITEECFDDLDARPIRLSSQDIPTPYNGNLENLTIIQPHQIVEKVEDLISGSI